MQGRRTYFMKINIDDFTEAELVDLNRCIVERLRLPHQMRAHRVMLEFRVGERVCFDPSDGRPEVIGVIAKYNQKTVTIITDDGHKWRVSPQVLKRAKTARDGATAHDHDGKVVRLF